MVNVTPVAPFVDFAVEPKNTSMFLDKLTAGKLAKWRSTHPRGAICGEGAVLWIPSGWQVDVGVLTGPTTALATAVIVPFLSTREVERQSAGVLNWIKAAGEDHVKFTQTNMDDMMKWCCGLRVANPLLPAVRQLALADDGNLEPTPSVLAPAATAAGASADVEPAADTAMPPAVLAAAAGVVAAATAAGIVDEPAVLAGDPAPAVSAAEPAVAAVTAPAVNAEE
jgi:hypothetical protein